MAAGGSTKLNASQREFIRKPQHFFSPKKSIQQKPPCQIDEVVANLLPDLY
jgi:hypothetical protein